MISRYDYNNRRRKKFKMYRLRKNFKNASIYSETYFKNKRFLTLLRDRFRLKFFSTNYIEEFKEKKKIRLKALKLKLAIIKRKKRKTKI